MVNKEQLLDAVKGWSLKKLSKLIVSPQAQVKDRNLSKQNKWKQIFARIDM
jgi:hypothetical protein